MKTKHYRVFICSAEGSPKRPKYLVSHKIDGSSSLTLPLSSYPRKEGDLEIWTASNSEYYYAINYDDGSPECPCLGITFPDKRQIFESLILDKAKEPDPFEIAPQQIGLVHLGMKIRELKQLYPNATYRRRGEEGGTSIEVRQDSEALFHVYNASSSLPEDDDTIASIETDNPRYATTEGIRPGSLLIQAAHVYGSIKLYYNPDEESAEFENALKSATSKMGFRVAAPPGKQSAGLYPPFEPHLDPRIGNCSSARGCESNQFYPGSKIVAISISLTK